MSSDLLMHQCSDWNNVDDKWDKSRYGHFGHFLQKNSINILKPLHMTT